jgi:hypothetical protein
VIALRRHVRMRRDRRAGTSKGMRLRDDNAKESMSSVARSVLRNEVSVLCR